MNRLLFLPMFLALSFLPGCGNAAPPEDPPQKQMLDAVNSFVTQLEDLEKQHKNAAGDAKKTTDALDAGTKKLEEVKKALEDNAEKVTKQLTVERNAHNLPERRE